MFQPMRFLVPVLLVSCASPAPMPPPSTPPASSASAAPVTDYDLYTWRDLNDTSRECHFVLFASRGKDRSRAITEVLASTDKGIPSLESRVRALPEGSSLYWGPSMWLNASYYYSLLSDSTVNKLKQIAAERKMTLILEPSLPAYPGAADQRKGCVE